MKDRKFFIPMAAALALAAGVTSCTNDDELLSSGTTTEGRTPIILTSNVVAAGSRTVDQNLQNTQIEAGVKVGVFAFANSEFIENGDNNVLTADGNGGFTGTEMYFEEDELTLYAYAPYNSSWTGGYNSNMTFSVATDQSTEDGYLASDLLIGTPTNGNPVASTTDAIGLTFVHKLVKVNINLNVENDEDGNATIDLKGATVNICNVVTSAPVNVSTGTVGNVSGSETEIVAAKFGDDATTFTASAIFPPQYMLSGTAFVVVTTADGNSYKAVLSEDVEFASGKKYTYTVTLSGVETEAILESVVTEWEDGNEDTTLEGTEATYYGIGDYMLNDGTFVKNGQLTDEQKSSVVAVIFSKSVSTADADEGYNGYAMGLWRFGNKAWNITDVAMNDTYDSYVDAYNDLDGLTKTRAILASDEYAALEDKSSNFVNYTNYTNSHPLPTDGTASEWFTPSFGQMIQIFNNLGGAGLTASMDLMGPDNTSSPKYYVTTTDVLDNINAYVTGLGDDEMFLTDTNSDALLYYTVTEYSTGACWAFTTRKTTVSGDDTIYAWGFGCNAYKSSGGRSVAPCVAVTLPAVQ